MKIVDLIFHDAGGGHRSAATALKMVIEQQGRPWQVRLVNLQDVLDPLDIARKLTGLRIQEIYNGILNRGWTLGSAQLLRVLQTVIRVYHRPAVRLLENYWRETQPDMVVSLVPHFNRVFSEAIGRARSGAPFVTILTDLADYPPRFWIEPVNQVVVCGSDKAVEQARGFGHSPERIFRASGMILHPKFYQPVTADRAAERTRLGLDPERKTGLVMFGGQGSPVMLQIADRLDRSELGVQLILICGRNERLATGLRARKFRMPVFIEGFTKEIPDYMHLSDFFIGKPGPGSLSEALAMRLPVIVERNAWTLPQERYNTEWVREKQLGVVVKHFTEIASAVERLLEPETFARFCGNAAQLNNRAIFDIPEFLNRVLEQNAEGSD